MLERTPHIVSPIGISLQHGVLHCMEVFGSKAFENRVPQSLGKERAKKLETKVPFQH